MEGTLGADPLLEVGVGQFVIQLLKARKAKDKAVE
jgi:hypothetical protein